MTQRRRPLPAFGSISLAWAGVVLLSAACETRVYPIRAATPQEIACPDVIAGFATVDGDGTTGGGGATPMLITDVDNFKSAVAATDPLVIRLQGNFAISSQIRVSSNKTIIGVGSGSGFTGSGLNLTDGQNIVIRNLAIAKPRDGDSSTDAITIERSKHIWVDHCDLSSDRDHDRHYYDGLVDVTHASDDVTVSWTVFHDHFDTSLVGHSADNGTEDTGHLTVTYHHNLFQDVLLGIRARFGSVHIYDNHFLNVTPAFDDLGEAVIGESSVAMLVEQNVFAEVPVPITTHYKDALDGTARELQDLYVSPGSQQMNDITQTSTWAPPYGYVPDSAASVPTIVGACAGVGKLNL